MKGHILLCTYSFPPVAGPRGLRWLYLSRELIDRGWRVDVLTIEASAAHPYYDDKTVELIPPSVRVFRTYPGPSYRLRFEYYLHLKRNVKPEAHRTLLDRAIEALMNQGRTLEWPFFALWQGRRLLKQNHYDVIISSGGPFTAHIIGYFLKRWSDRPWIAEYGDPWAFHPGIAALPAWRQILDKKLEGMLLRSVDGVIVATETVRQGYLQHYPFLSRRRTFVIPSGYDPEQYRAIPAARSSKFRIVHTGVFYPGLRDPDAFFEALKALSDLDLEVIIAGGVSPEYRERVARAELRQVYFTGHLPHQQTIALQKGATVLLLVGNNSTLMLPSKIFEYIAAQRPVMVVQYSDADLAARLVKQYRRGLVVNNKANDIAEGLRSLYALWKVGGLEEPFCLDELVECSWGARTISLEAAAAVCMNENH